MVKDNNMLLKANAVDLIKGMLDGMPNKDLDKVSRHISKLYDDREPTVTLHMGQVVEWTPQPEFGKKPVTLIGFSGEEQVDVKRPYIMEYMRDYKCFRLTRADASRVIPQDRYVDLSAVLDSIIEDTKS